MFRHAAVIALGMFQFGILIGQWNCIALVFRYLNQWDDDTNTLNNALVTTFANGGAMLGAFLAPAFSKKGSRNAQLLLNVLTIAALAVQMFTQNMIV